MRRLAKNGKLDTVWYNHGGKETIQSYDSILGEDREKHIEFFKNLKNFYIDEQNRLYLHAGFTSLDGPRVQDDTVLCWDRSLWEMAINCDHLEPSDSFYSEKLKLFNEIYIGHTPTTRRNVFVPWKQSNVWNVDTGAAFRGKLSILDVDSKEYWQSDPLCTLYPNEMGRNR